MAMEGYYHATAHMLNVAYHASLQLKKEGKLLSGKQKAEAERLAKIREQMLANANLPLPGASLMNHALAEHDHSHVFGIACSS
jgi:hypothetical protein